MLVREADPELDWEMVTDVLLAPLATDSYVYWCRAQGMPPERVIASYDLLVDRLLPPVAG